MDFIDLNRWLSASALLWRVVKQGPRSTEDWEWVRAHYAMSLAVYSLMTEEQQQIAAPALDLIGTRLERLSH
jgi:hypothetical protein